MYRVSDVPTAPVIDRIIQLPWGDVMARFLRAMRPNPHKPLNEESRLRFEQLRQLALDPSRHFICLGTEQVDIVRWSALKGDDLVARLVLRVGDGSDLRIECVVASKQCIDQTAFFNCETPSRSDRICMAVFNFEVLIHMGHVDDIYINDRGLSRTLRGQDLLRPLSMVLFNAVSCYMHARATISSATAHIATLVFVRPHTWAQLLAIEQLHVDAEGDLRMRNQEIGAVDSTVKAGSLMAYHNALTFRLSAQDYPMARLPTLMHRYYQTGAIKLEGVVNNYARESEVLRPRGPGSC